VFQLAANMGTSVEMIESFYGKKANAGSEDGNGGDEFQGTVIHTTSRISSLRNNDQTDRPKNPSRYDSVKEKSHS
jgi:hypothetical protein